MEIKQNVIGYSYYITLKITIMSKNFISLEKIQLPFEGLEELGDSILLIKGGNGLTSRSGNGCGCGSGKGCGCGCGCNSGKGCGCGCECSCDQTPPM